MTKKKPSQTDKIKALEMENEILKMVIDMLAAPKPAVEVRVVPQITYWPYPQYVYVQPAPTYYNPLYYGSFTTFGTTLGTLGGGYTSYGGSSFGGGLSGILK